MVPAFRQLILMLTALSALQAAAQTPAKSPLNVVLITIDTLRADHLGCYGYKQIKTPNIDGLAADGVRFASAFAVVPVTLPSHSSMLTGTYPMLSGMHDFSGNKLSPLQPTLASVLKQAGYQTGAVIGAAVLDSRFGLNRGFDFYYDHFDFSRLDEANLDEMERPGNVVADVALDWLGKNSQKKFFLWMHLYDPHSPYHPPDPYSREYAAHLYDGEIAFADEQVGRLLRFLKEKGIYQNTVIVLCGDHGESLGEHGEKTHGFFIYNATMHVPLIIRLPENRLPENAAARTVADPVSLVDLMPTVLGAVGLETPSQVQGRNLLSEFRADQSNRDRVLYGETFLPRIHFNWSELRGSENTKYHFIDAPRPELYDLAKDPAEVHNLFTEKKAVAEEMRVKLTGMIRDYSAGKELAEKTGLDPALMERLKALGYAGFSGGSDPTSNDPAISSRSLPDPKDRVVTYELISDAIADSQHGRYQESIDKLKTVVKTEPNSVPAHYLLGLNYYRLQMFAEAVDELQKTVQLSPDYALAFFNLGMAQAHAGQMDAAIATLQRTLQLDATNFEAAYNLGVAFIQKRQLEPAAAALRQSVTIYPEFARGHRALGETLLYLDKLDDAIAELRRAVELAPQEPIMHESLAKALAAKGLTAEADEETRRAQHQPAPQ
jgi:arylsulfatase A-like enzyme/cytochrome c-type biogenesis protein CcmH/NrfG